jgi:predicted Zn-dependent protease
MQKKTDEAIKVLERNAQEYPNAWNPYDSLAEAYMAAGQKSSPSRITKSLSRSIRITRTAQRIEKAKGGK